MAINLDCAKCGAEIELDDSLRGSTIACPECAARIEVPPVLFATGKVLAGYRIDKLLGVGAMGQVFLANQLSMDRPVALKVVPPEVMKSDEDVKRFINEVRLLARIDHPNVVTAFEAGQAEGVYFMAMSFVNGETLDLRLEREGTVPEKEALVIALKVAEALNYAWDQHHLLHRDLKPANIMIDREGEVKLMDMGISKGKAEEKGLTMAGFIIGTPYYMSPEQTKASPDLDFRSDIYSLGATLYHLVTGKVPYDGPSVMEILVKHSVDPVPSPRAINPAISPECDALVRTMMAKKAIERPASWAALVADLKRVVQGKPAKVVAAKSKGAGHKARLGARNLASPRLSTPLPAGPRASSSARPAATPPPAAPPSPPKARGRGLLVGVGLVLGLSVAGAGVWWAMRPAPAPVAPPPVPAPPVAVAPPPVVPPPPGDTVPEPPKGPSPEELAAQQKLAERLRFLESEFKAAKDFAQAMQAEDPQAVIDRFAALLPQTDGTPLQAAVKRAMQQARDAQTAALDQLQRQLASAASKLEDEGDLAGARAVYQNYEGPMAAASANWRQQQVAGLGLRQQQGLRVQRLEAARLMLLKDAVATAILASNPQAAAQAVEAASQGEALKGQAEEVTKLTNLMATANNLPQRVLEAFRPDIGKEVTLQLKDKRQMLLELASVEAGELRGLEIVTQGSARGKVRATVKVSDLAPVERLRRLGDDQSEGALLCRGLLALEAVQAEAAKRSFAQVACLAPSFESVAGRSQAATLEAQAQAAWLALLAVVGLDAAQPVSKSLEQLWAAEWTDEQEAELAYHLELFTGRYGQSTVAQRQKGLQTALTSKLQQLAEGGGDLSKLRREVSQELRQRNPDLVLLNDNWCRLTPEGARVDLSKQTELRDLTPLAKLPVISLNLIGSGVSDLTPLNGLPLRELQADGLKVASLNPLRGLPLIKLSLNGVALPSLAALKECPLEELSLMGCELGEIDSLRGLPLLVLHLANSKGLKTLEPLFELPQLQTLTVPKEIDLAGLEACKSLRRVGFEPGQLGEPGPFIRQASNSQKAEERRKLEELVLSALDQLARQNDIFRREGRLHNLLRIEPTSLELEISRRGDLHNIDALKGLPITHLNLSRTNIMDLGPLKGMPLVSLSIGFTKVVDLSPLAGMKLTHLDIRGCSVGNPEIVNTFPLTSLYMTGDTIRELAFIKNLPLKSLGISSTQVKDLRPIKAMPLTTLDLSWTLVEDLRDLKDQKLTSLTLRGVKLRNFDELSQYPLAHLDLSNTPCKTFNFLRNMPLERLFLAETEFSNAQVLRDKQLVYLDLRQTQVKNISGLEGLKLRFLILQETEITDIGPLKGMPLEELNLAKTAIRSVEALAGLPLRRLRLDGCDRLQDLSPLANCRELEVATVPEDARNIEVLRTLPNLRNLDYRTGDGGEVHTLAADFWRRFDANKGGKKKP